LINFLNHLLVERGLSLNTLDSYSRDLHKYLDFLLAQGLKDITETTDVNHYPVSCNPQKASLVSSFHRSQPFFHKNVL